MRPTFVVPPSNDPTFVSLKGWITEVDAGGEGGGFNPELSTIPAGVLPTVNPEFTTIPVGVLPTVNPEFTTIPVGVALTVNPEFTTIPVGVALTVNPGIPVWMTIATDAETDSVRRIVESRN
jgi:hypothetical protein